MITGKSLRGLLLGAVVAVLLIGAILYFTLVHHQDGGKSAEALLTERWVYPEERRARGAIASNGGPCSSIGMRILEKGGRAADALIATMLCDGVACMQNMGIGGGFIATLYIRSEKRVVTLNARETAPAAADKDMFLADDSQALVGGKAVAVPGEIRGYRELYEKYGGGVTWSELFQGTIALCEEGVPVSRHLEHNMRNNKKLIMSMPELKKLLVKENDKLPEYGDKIKLLKLAKTLRTIAEEGADAFYNGSLTAGLVKDIRDNNGIITEEDMASYKVRWEEPVSTKLSSGDAVYSVPLPGSGTILTLIMKLLDNELPQDLHDINTTFKITEAFKIAYGIRSKLGDPHFVNDTEVLNKLNNVDYINSLKKKLNAPKTSNDVNYYGSHYVEDHGTANIVVFAPNGDAISATSTINTIFGSGVVSASTGIILNNEMDDFSTPGLVNYFGVYPSSENYIEPHKRPMSSMAPAIVLDKNGEPRLITGGAGGTKITTATALTIIRNIWFNKSSTESVKEPRFHHQLMPMKWSYEPSVDKGTVEGMKERGHEVLEGSPRESCITAISIKGDVLGPSSDFRRPGNTSFLL